MDFTTKERVNFEGFRIEDNIINGIKINYDIRDRNLGQIILDCLNSEPNHKAWIDDDSGRQITFADIKDSSIRLALWMKKEGIKKNDVVSLCTPNRIENYSVLFATLYIGAVYHPWHHDFVLESARYAMNMSKPKIIFSWTNAIDTIYNAAELEDMKPKIIAFGDHQRAKSFDSVIEAQNIEEIRLFKVREVDNSDVAIILFSSGSTGPPKGVMVTYQALLYSTICTSVISVLPKSVVLWYSTSYWIVGTIYMIISIYRKITAVNCRQYDPELICRLIEKYKVDVMISNPNWICSLCKNKFVDKYKMKALKKVLYGGTRINKTIAEQFRLEFPHVEFYQAYGMSETGLVTLQTENCKNKESVGYLLPNMQLKIVDKETDAALQAHQEGEICLKSLTQTIGYYNNPKSTADLIDTDGWLHTGDKGYYDESGEIFIVGRYKDVIRFRYHHISSAEIEEYLLNRPDVLEVCVTTIPHDEDVERAIAFVKKAQGSKVTADELVEMSAELGYYKKLWGGVKFLDELPQTPSGKVAKRILTEMAKSLTQE